MSNSSGWEKCQHRQPAKGGILAILKRLKIVIANADKITKKRNYLAVSVLALIRRWTGEVGLRVQLFKSIGYIAPLGNGAKN